MSIVKLLTQSDTAKLIDTIRTAAGELQTAIHQAACSTLDHARAHGDWTGITRLCDALPNGQRVKALAYWYGFYSNGRVSLSRNKETGAWQVNKDRFASRVDEDFKVAEAMETTFADLTVEKDPQPLTLAKFIKSLSRTATNTEKFDGTDIEKVTGKARTVASRLMALTKSDPELVALLADEG